MKKGKVSVPGLSPVYTLEEVAEILRVYQKTVYRLVSNKELVAFQVGRIFRFDEPDLLDFIKRSKEKVKSSAKKSY